MTLAKVFVFCLFLIGTVLVQGDEEARNAKEIVDIEPELTTTDGEEVDAVETVAEDVDNDVEEENDVLILTEENFDSVVNSNRVILIEFYAPWCGHCKSLAPEYEKAATKLKTNDPPVALAKVDATVHTTLASKYGVSGYPTLKYFIEGGDANDYDGPRQADGIVDYMIEKADPNYKPPPPAAIVLTTADFDEVVNKEPLMLVEFFAPWCGHCKKLAPEYEKAAKQLQKADPPIPLATVDATVESSLATKFGVSGYPTLKVFRFGKAYEYKGGRDEYGIVDYMEKQRGDGTKEVKSLKELQKSFNEEDVTIVGFFKNSDSKFYNTYMDIANDLREEYTFFHTFDATALGKYNVKDEAVVVVPAVRFETRYEPKVHTLDQADASADDIKSFLEKHQNPLVGLYSSGTSQKRYKEARPLMVMFYTVDFSFDHRQGTQMWRLKLADIAKNYPTITFAIADEEEQGELFKKFGFDESGEEINIGILGKKDARYPMESFDEFDSDEIRAFLDKFSAGKLKPKLTSQPIPKKKKGPVTVVVGKTFEKIVLDPKKDVMIELYAPWCGHCKSLEPIYKDLAKHFKSEKNLVIAKMDATANDAPPTYDHSGFPTIYFAPAGRKDDPIKYEGGRTKDDMIKFIQENAVASLQKAKDEL